MQNEIAHMTSSAAISRRKFVELLAVGALGAMTLPAISGCSSQSQQESAATEAPASTGTEITIEACDETAAYRENVVFSGSYDARTLNEAEQLAGFAMEIASLSSRTTQTFPDVATNNTLGRADVSTGKVYTLTGSSKYERVVLFIHGGSWISEINSGQVAFCDELVDLLNAKVYMPLYPLAPQATAKDTYAMLRETYEELLSEGKPIYVMGDSAGGTCALGLTLDLKSAGVTLPQKVVAISPAADIATSNEDILEYQKRDGMLPMWYCLSCAKLWAGEMSDTDPKVSPIKGDFSGYPDTLMYVGDCDILMPDDVLLYEKMVAAGVTTELVRGVGFWHDYLLSQTIEEHPELVQILKDFCLD